MCPPFLTSVSAQAKFGISYEGMDEKAKIVTMIDIEGSQRRMKARIPDIGVILSQILWREMGSYWNGKVV